MEALASGSASVRDLISGADGPAEPLGSFPTAIYLRLARGDVVAVLSRDAIRLPLGLVVPTSSLEFPLNRLAGPVRVGSARVQIGDWSVRLSRLVSVQAPTGLVPSTEANAHVWHELAGTPVTNSHLALPPLLQVTSRRIPFAPELFDRLLGAGPGLTPSGDDVLAGLLIGARSFGLPTEALRTRLLDAAPGGTTDLSAALLRCACRGESIPQVKAMLTAMSRRKGYHVAQLHDALRDLCAVGHTSGKALASGVAAAATTAAWVREHEGDQHDRVSHIPRVVGVLGAKQVGIRWGSGVSGRSPSVCGQVPADSDRRTLCDKRAGWQPRSLDLPLRG